MKTFVVKLYQHDTGKHARFLVVATGLHDAEQRVRAADATLENYRREYVIDADVAINGPIEIF